MVVLYSSIVFGKIHNPAEVTAKCAIIYLDWLSVISSIYKFCCEGLPSGFITGV